MKHLLKAILCFILLFTVNSSRAQTSFYNIDTVQKIEMFFHEPDWEHILDSLKILDLGYLRADSVRINGSNFPNAGVKYKGNSSYDSAYVKNPFTIKLDKFVSQNYQGIKSIKLANCFDDPSMIREVLAYAVLGRYMHCSRSNFAEVWINGNRIGLYSNDEDITKPFVLSHFYSSNNTFIKCSPLYAAPAIKSNLKYIDTAAASYSNAYEMESSGSSDWKNLIALCDVVTNQPAKLDSMLDIDRVVWMLAFNNAIVNMDSYNGVFAQNYFLYKDATGHYNPIIWDLNMAFGGFNFAGAPGNSMGTMTFTDMAQLATTSHATHTDWPVINAVQNNATWKRMYMAHLRTIVKENFVSGYYDTLAARLQNTANAYVAADTHKFFTTADFLNGMTTDKTVNGRTVPGIKNLMAARIAFFNANAEYNLVAPQFLAVRSDDYAPDSGDVVTITAKVNGATTVSLGYRSDSTIKFAKLQMYDDGLHGDSLAGDFIYGASFTMQKKYAQYYVYAENNDAGKFAPERAEHEFYSLPGSQPVIVSASTVFAESVSDLTLYPNPVQDKLYLDWNGNEKAFITVTDMAGRVILQSDAATKEIHVAELPKGVYLLHAKTTKMNVVRKFEKL
ncbi:MAG TPA: CotH kinase family protein [Flavipsychrobacter sp.]|nr:CotH kinase family protein [Flavipsychrobacter sp.]